MTEEEIEKLKADSKKLILENYRLLVDICFLEQKVEELEFILKGRTNEKEI